MTPLVKTSSSPLDRPCGLDAVDSGVDSGVVLVKSGAGIDAMLVDVEEFRSFNLAGDWVA